LKIFGGVVMILGGATIALAVIFLGGDPTPVLFIAGMGGAAVIYAGFKIFKYELETVGSPSATEEVKVVERAGSRRQQDLLECIVCGCIVKDHVPDRCPMCGADRGSFKSLLG